MKPLIFYFTADFPSKQIFADFIEKTDSDIVKYIEIGIPTENPLYDGPLIKTTHTVARNEYSNQDLASISGLIKKKGIKPYLLAYYAVLESQGTKFLDFLHDSGYSGIIIPDLLIDHFDERLEIIKDIEKRMSFIPFFNPATPDSVIKEVAGLTSSWVYYGLQPSTGINVPFDLEEVSNRIVSLLPNREVNFGFGVRTVKQVEEIISLGSSGVAIGSMLVPMLKNNDLNSYREFQTNLKEALRVAN